MATAPKQLCSKAGCFNITVDNRCDMHKTKTAERKHSSDQWARKQRQAMYNHRWRAARLVFLSSNPLCVMCQVEGTVSAATVVDHIEDHKGCEDKFWDVSNWQPLCSPCHNSKTAKDNPR